MSPLTAAGRRGRSLARVLDHEVSRKSGDEIVLVGVSRPPASSIAQAQLSSEQHRRI